MRNFFKYLFELYSYGNFHIALCAFALTGVSRRLFHQDLDLPYALFAFCGTLFIYNLQRVIAAPDIPSTELTNSPRKKFMSDNTVILAVITILSAIASGMIFILYLFERITPLLLLFPAVISLAYALPIIRTKRGNARLRDLPFIKIVLIALVWSYVTAFLPVTDGFTDVNALSYSSLHGWLWTFSVFFFILALTIPFDIRDMNTDKAGIKSLPQLFEIRMVKIIGIVFLCLSLLCVTLFDLLLYSQYGAFNYTFLMAFAIWIVGCVPVLLFTEHTRTEFYFSFVVDGMLILLYILILIARHI